MELYKEKCFKVDKEIVKDNENSQACEVRRYGWLPFIFHITFIKGL